MYFYANVGQNGNKIVWQDIGSGNDEIVQAIGKNRNTRKEGSGTC